MASKVGFFEKRKLDKLAQSLPDHGPDKEIQTYINVAKNYGATSLIRLACVLESLPKEWKDRSDKKYLEDYRYFKLKKLCLIGLPETVTPDDVKNLLINIDDIDIGLVTKVLVKIGGDTIQQNMIKSLASDNLRRRLIALEVLQKSGDSSFCSQIAELVSEPRLRAAAIEALGELKCVNSLDSILIGLRDEDSAVVKSSLVTLARMPTDDVADALIEFATPYVSRYERTMKNETFDRNELNLLREILSALAAHKHPVIFSLMERVGNAMVPNFRAPLLFAGPINDINIIVWKYTGNERYMTQLTP